MSVLITPAFRTARPETAITILVHELSHVLLHSLRHPERDGEVFTDLVPIVLGFAKIVRRGRTVASVAHEGGTTRPTMTTYGYLSDADFSFALGRVDALLGAHQKSRLRLLADVASLRLAATRATGAVTRFGQLRHRLDTKPGRIRKADAAGIVAAHAADYTVKIEGAIRNALDVAAKAGSFGEAVRQYPKYTLVELHEYERLCASAASRLDRTLLELRNDLSLLARNCGVRYRFVEVFAGIADG